MLLNSTSSSDTVLPPNLSLSDNSYLFEMNCFSLFPGMVTFTSFLIFHILLVVPLCILILYHSFQQWWKDPSNSSAASMSHSDSFTYHAVTMEMITFSGCVVSFCGICTHQVNILSVGLTLLSFTGFGENSFHTLMCVERYLAVIHPITYMRLRNQRGVRLRNVSISCVWLGCIVLAVLLTDPDFFAIVNFCIVVSSLTVISFCSLSVLCALTHSGPGERVEGRVMLDRTKKKAFYTIASILGVLVLRFTCNLAWVVELMINKSSSCGLMSCDIWFNLPSSLVLPLLFLHRKPTFSSLQTCSKFICNGFTK